MIPTNIVTGIVIVSTTLPSMVCPSTRNAMIIPNTIESIDKKRAFRLKALFTASTSAVITGMNIDIVNMTFNMNFEKN